MSDNFIGSLYNEFVFKVLYVCMLSHFYAIPVMHFLFTNANDYFF